MADADRGARARAESRFRALQSDTEAQEAERPAYEVAADATREKMARLKALREAREAAEKERADVARDRARKARSTV